MSYLQINHEFNESFAVMYFVHGYRPYGKGRRKIIEVSTLLDVREYMLTMPNTI